MLSRPLLWLLTTPPPIPQKTQPFLNWKQVCWSNSKCLSCYLLIHILCVYLFIYLLSSSDTASGYKNETDLGKILKILLPKFNLKRENIFITSKLGRLIKALSNYISSSGFLLLS